MFYVPNVSEWTHYVFMEHVKAYVVTCVFLIELPQTVVV